MPLHKCPKKSLPTKETDAILLPFLPGYGTSSTAIVSSSPSLFGDGYKTSSSSTPIVSSLSSTLEVVGDCISPTQANTKEAAKRKWTAEVWQADNVYDGNIFEDGEDRAICKSCKLGPMLASTKNGTSNFIRHTKKCEAHNVSGQGLPAVSVNMSGYKEAVALCIIRHVYPFTFVEHKGNRDLHLLLNPEYKPICRNKAKNYVMKIHQREKGKMKALLGRVLGGICLTSDMWTSFTGQGFIFMTAHFIDDDLNLHAKILDLHAKILDLCHVEPPHTTIVLHDRLLGLLTSWGILDKLFSITLDNARCNDNMQDLLAQSLSLQNLCFVMAITSMYDAVLIY